MCLANAPLTVYRTLTLGPGVSHATDYTPNQVCSTEERKHNKSRVTSRGAVTIECQKGLGSMYPCYIALKKKIPNKYIVQKNKTKKGLGNYHSFTDVSVSHFWNWGCKIRQVKVAHTKLGKNVCLTLPSFVEPFSLQT